MRPYIRLLSATVLVAAAARAPAQTAYDYDYQRPVQWHIDGGYVATEGRTSDFLRDGWTFGTGLTWHPDPRAPFAIRADLHFSRFDATNELLTIGSIVNQTRIDNGTGDIVDLDVDAVFEAPLGPRAKLYVLGGVGGAYRRIDLTQTVGIGGIICDPWWGFCERGFFAGDVLIDREETTKFAWNAGLGVDFALYNGQTFFVEARYNRMQTQDPTEFVPIRIGLRF